MCEPYNVEGLVRRPAPAQYPVLKPQRERNSKSTVPSLGPMTAIPEDIFPYETQSSPNHFVHYSTRFVKAPRYATHTQILPQSPPPTMTQTKETLIDISSSQPGSADNFGPLNPIHKDFEEQLPNRSNHFYGDNLSRPFRHSNLRPKQDKDVVIFELYRFKKYSKDWTVADKIRISAPQDELEKKVGRGKGRIPIVGTMMNMHHIRRDRSIGSWR
jgi:hypothetical protein